MADEADRAYVAGLKMLARRELSETQVRARLERRAFDAAAVDAAVARLRRERALDEHRTARACARDEAHLKHHGRLRALRQIQAMGISREVAREAVREVFGELDEDALIARALERRLRAGAPVAGRAGLLRVHRYLLAQGFEAGRVTAAITTRMKTSPRED